MIQLNGKMQKFAYRGFKLAERFNLIWQALHF